MKPSVVIASLLAATSLASAQEFQTGSRAKAMGGSYTAFEDDPVSIWMNPAGIATQSTQMVLSYQSYSQYPVNDAKADLRGGAEIGLLSPVIVPSILGLVMQFGTPEHAMAAGVAFIRPTHLHMTFDTAPTDDVVDLLVDQEFVRFRTAFAYDIRVSPPGEPGVLTHLSIGGGADIGYTEWRQSAVAAGSITQTFFDRRTMLGNGVGLLMGLYDNTETFKIDLGVAYNFGMRFDFGLDDKLYPVFRWPSMTTGGVTFHLLRGMPLRVTFDVQHIAWGGATNGSTVAGKESFRDVTNASMGAEYRIKLDKEGVAQIYPRAGWRYTQHMWDGELSLPAIGNEVLFIETRGAFAWSFTMGFGITWTGKDGKTRGIDAAWEQGFWFMGTQDTFSMSFGCTFEL
jgi:hypothetical protein